MRSLSLSLCIRGGGGEVFLGARGGEVNQLTARREGGHHTSRTGRRSGRRRTRGAKSQVALKQSERGKAKVFSRTARVSSNTKCDDDEQAAEDLARGCRAIRLSLSLSLFPSSSCNLSKLSKQLPQLEAVSPIHLILPNSMATAAAKAAAVASGSNTWVKRG